MDLLFLFLIIVDGLVIGMTVGGICRLLLGDKPFARLIRLLLGIISGILYSIMCIHLGYGETDLSMGMFLLIIFGPLALLFILWIIGYMYQNESTNKDTNENSK